MKKTIIGLLTVAILAPSASFAYEPINITNIDVSQYNTQESLEELRVLLMKHIITLLQIRVQELIALRDGSIPQPLVLGATTDTTEEKEKPRRRRGGSNSSSNNNESTDSTTEQTTTTLDDTGLATSTDEQTIVPSLTVSAQELDLVSTPITISYPVEYGLARINFKAGDEDITLSERFSIKIYTPGTLPTEVLEKVSLIGFGYNLVDVDRPMATFVLDTESTSTGHYVYSLPEPVTLAKDQVESVLITGIFTDSFDENQTVQVRIESSELNVWDIESLNQPLTNENIEGTYVGPTFTLRHPLPGSYTTTGNGPFLEELQVMVSNLVTQIEALGGDTSDVPTESEQQEMSVEELQQLINNLLAQIAQLQGGQQTDPSVAVCPYAWTRDLAPGSVGEDVLKLQQFMNADPHTRVSLAGEGSLGNETDSYISLLESAISKFQVKYRSEVLSPRGIVYPTGEFDPATRAKANSLCAAIPELEGDTSTVTDDSQHKG